MNGRKTGLKYLDSFGRKKDAKREAGRSRRADDRVEEHTTLSSIGITEEEHDEELSRIFAEMSNYDLISEMLGE